MKASIMVEGRKVLRVNAVEETAAYRAAVAEILRRVQSDHGCTLLEISEAIDVSLGTISNAANKKADLSPTFLQRLGRVYGPHSLDPYAALMGGRVVPLETTATADILPFMTLVTHKVAVARSANSPAGVVETLGEQCDYLPDLRHLQREITALICRIEERKAAA